MNKNYSSTTTSNGDLNILAASNDSRTIREFLHNNMYNDNHVSRNNEYTSTGGMSNVRGLNNSPKLKSKKADNPRRSMIANNILKSDRNGIIKHKFY